ncbi:MAG: response regulator [Desulfobacteraceae bacterium]
MRNTLFPIRKVPKPMAKILIVDDDWLTRVELGEMLVDMGYEVAGKADTGKGAVDMAGHLKPDLILMDVVIPGGMNGIEAACRIKTVLDIPVVFISGYSNSEYVEQAKQIDPFGYVVKPFDESTLRACVEIALHKRKMELELKAANELLERSNRQLRGLSREWEGIFQAIGQPALILDRGQFILNANYAASECANCAEGDLVGKRCYQIFHRTPTPPLNCPFEKMIHSGQTETAEMEMGISRRVFWVSCTPIGDSRGCPDKVIHIATDITEKRDAEEAMREIDRMKAVNTLAGGIAHQFNNLLTIISGRTGLLGMYAAQDERMARHIAAIDGAVVRMARLTSQLLAYARGGRYTVKTVEFSRLIRDCLLEMNLPEMDSGVHIKTSFPPDDIHVDVDVPQFKTVLSALVDNACEALDGSGCIRISVKHTVSDAKLTKAHPALNSAPVVCLSVQDNGKGMDEETRGRIFDPFFTTHFLGRGLGMAAVYGIVKNHKGAIQVDSAPGKGTTVRIYLPGKKWVQSPS